MKINRAMQVVFVAGACVYGASVGSPAFAAPILDVPSCGDETDDGDEDEEGSEETRLCGGDSDGDEDEKGDGEETSRL